MKKEDNTNQLAEMRERRKAAFRRYCADHWSHWREPRNESEERPDIPRRTTAQPGRYRYPDF
jgi:hypothetical protein